MKVLVINWRDIQNPDAGGAEVHIDELLKRKPNDWEVDFVSATFPGCAPETDLHGYHVIRIPNNLFFHLTFKHYWKKDFSKRGYDLVIDDISKIPLKTPNYITQPPLLAIHHHIHGKSLYQELSFPMAFYVITAEKFGLKRYAQTPFLAVSRSNELALKKLAAFQNITVIENGIDLSEIQNADFAKFKKPTLIYFGRLKKYKRVDHLLQAFSMVLKDFPDAEFHIGGKGDDSERLKSLTKKFGISDSVRFLGFVSNEDKLKLLHGGWVMGITSEKEGWGIVVIEANAAKTPVVGYDVEGLCDSIVDGKSGYLVENGDISAVAEKITRLFRDEELRINLGEGAKKWADRFTWEKAAERFYALCEDVCRKKS